MTTGSKGYDNIFNDLTEGIEAFQKPASHPKDIIPQGSVAKSEEIERTPVEAIWIPAPVPEAAKNKNDAAVIGAHKSTPSPSARIVPKAIPLTSKMQKKLAFESEQYEDKKSSTKRKDDKSSAVEEDVTKAASLENANAKMRKKAEHEIAEWKNRTKRADITKPNTAAKDRPTTGSWTEKAKENSRPTRAHPTKGKYDPQKDIKTHPPARNDVRPTEAAKPASERERGSGPSRAR